MGRLVTRPSTESAEDVTARRWLHGASFAVLTTRDDEPSWRRSAKARRLVLREWSEGEASGNLTASVERTRTELVRLGFARAVELADERSREPGPAPRPSLQVLSGLTHGAR